MHRLLIPTAVAVGALLVSGLATPVGVQAHDGATGVVKERMDMMKSFSAELKAVARMFKGETAYDPVAVAAAARRIEAHSGAQLLRMFPEGSDDPPSKASDEIWTHWAEFEAKADDLGTRASALAAVADAGPDAARRAFGELAGTCKACHLDFEVD